MSEAKAKSILADFDLSSIGNCEALAQAMLGIHPDMAVDYNCSCQDEMEDEVKDLKRRLRRKLEAALDEL